MSDYDDDDDYSDDDDDEQPEADAGTELDTDAAMAHLAALDRRHRGARMMETNETTLERMRRESTRSTCEECGAPIPEPQAWQTRCPPCSARREEHIKRQRKRDALKELEGKAAHYIEKMSLPTWRYARFENDEWRSRVDPRILAAVEAWDGTSGLVLCGKSGCGKTSGIVAWGVNRMVKTFYEPNLVNVEGGKPIPDPHPGVWMISAFDLVRDRRAHPLGKGDAPLWISALQAPILLLDEVGQEPLADGLVFELADRRYRDESKVTAVTTGLTPKAFAERYGAAAWRRLRERAEVVDAHQPAAKALRAVQG